MLTLMPSSTAARHELFVAKQIKSLSARKQVSRFRLFTTKKNGFVRLVNKKRTLLEKMACI